MFTKTFKIKIVLAGLLMVFSLAAAQPVLALSPAASDACQGLVGIDSSAGTNCTKPSQSGSTLGNIISTVLNIISILIGAVAVIMILVAGFRFITSGGGEGVKSAKNTLIYALVGIAVAVLAQVLIHFVINRLGNNTTPPKPPTGSLQVV